MRKDVAFEIIVVGAGGTGTYVLKEFSRYLAGNARRVAGLHLFDGDMVEEKNLSRQAFQREDLGLNKAAVMADVLNQAFGLRWQAYGRYLTNRKQLDDIMGMRRRNYYAQQIIPLIVGCVDNHACRLLLERFFKSQKNCIYFDAANEFSTGEVVFSYKLNGKKISRCRSEIFPDVKKGDLRARTEISCEELNHVEPQHIATNMMAGNILLSELCAVMELKSHPGFVVFDATTLYMESFSAIRQAGGRAA